ncbi:hypothetical protein KO507_17015 [Gilvimarinus agarilyticus]|uniref:hypothetical protein n=1 Tax=Gilvimarinus sp. 2_MG-2023 TaxID=3062666 RepID=UPI001C0975D2|nr:hypothetical protein [Gilvimarinus sp. 2_MG-2023]MBU2887468.1 hypothetical protein [Gilvimarinus agarilyticus]MDO6572121.1 hypothetical protein [Gilvimarinus sp. 2_MG-2023]
MINPENQVYNRIANLETLLLMDYWEENDFPFILANIDIQTSPFFMGMFRREYLINRVKDLEADEKYVIEWSGEIHYLLAEDSEFLNLNRLVARIKEVWRNSKHPDSVKISRDSDDRGPIYLYESKYIIKWALQKRFTPKWLDWALSKGLLPWYEKRNEVASLGACQTGSESGAQIEDGAAGLDKPLATKTKNALLRTIYALSIVADDSPSENITKNANSLLAAIKAKNLDQPVTSKALSNYLQEGEALTKEKQKRDREKRH